MGRCCAFQGTCDVDRAHTFYRIGNNPRHEKLAAFFDVGVELQRRIGTFIVLFSMIEQQLEFVLLQRSEELQTNDIWPTDRLSVSDRLKAVRSLALSEPAVAHELILAAALGELLMDARHTVAHGAPLATARLERNRSWLGEPRKRPLAALQLADSTLDAAATASDILFRLLSSLGAHLSGHLDTARTMMPSDEDMQIAMLAAARIKKAMVHPQDSLC